MVNPRKRMYENWKKWGRGLLPRGMRRARACGCHRRPRSIEGNNHLPRPYPAMIDEIPRSEPPRWRWGNKIEGSTNAFQGKRRSGDLPGWWRRGPLDDSDNLRIFGRIGAGGSVLSPATSVAMAF